MRSVKLVGVVGLILTASCAVHIGSDGSGGNQPRSPQARRAAPPPPPPRPAPAPAPAPPPPPRAAPAPGPAPAPAPAPSQNTAVMPNTSGGQQAVLNLKVVQDIKARNPKQCGYTEVSPGNWVHVDCDKYKPSTRSVAHLSPRKLRMVKAHQISFKPLRLLKVKLPPGLQKGSVGAGGAPGVGGPAQVAENFPSTVDHRADNVEGPIKSQGSVGSCTAHSLSSTLDNAAIRAGNLKPGDRNAMTSALHVWSRYGLPNMGAAADGNIAQPVGVYTTWPQSDREACMLFQGTGGYATECSMALGVKAGSWRSDDALMAKYNKSQAEGIYKIASIEKLETNPPNMDELLGLLATGADVWAAFMIDGSAWSARKMNNAVIPDYNDVSGGHAVVVSGYRETPNGRQFMIHNSWGESWGDKGFAWISEAMVKKWMDYAYKVKITNGVKKEDLTDDDCAPDELVDQGTGICAIMCGTEQNPTRPNNGCK